MEYEPISQKTGNIINARPYTKMSEEVKQVLAFRTIILGECSVIVCRELNINYYTAKNMLSLYKRTGSFSKTKSENKKTKEPKDQGTRCPLAILLLDNEKLGLEYLNKLTTEEEQYLWKLHYFYKKGEIN